MVKEADHQFLFFLSKTYGKLPNDPFFEDMDPFVKLWLYESWSNELEQNLDKDRALGILIGSFSNPEAARDMHSKLNPQFVSDEESINKTMEEISRVNKLTRKQLKKSLRKGK